MRPREVRQAVLARAGWRCERCHAALGADYSLHHRRPRGMGGTKRPDLPSNLLALCGSGTTGCHGAVESRRADAVADGLLLRQHENPCAVGVLLPGGWVLLNPDGTVTPVESRCPDGAEDTAEALPTPNGRSRHA